VVRERGPSLAGDVFAKFRSSPLFEASKKRHAPGWTTGDLFADPLFVAFATTADGHSAEDLRLQPTSPAIDAGVPLPAEWPDVLRAADGGAPDIGALPLGAEPLKVGIVRQ